MSFITRRIAAVREALGQPITPALGARIFFDGNLWCVAAKIRVFSLLFACRAQVEAQTQQQQCSAMALLRTAHLFRASFPTFAQRVLYSALDTPCPCDNLPPSFRRAYSTQSMLTGVVVRCVHSAGTASSSGAIRGSTWELTSLATSTTRTGVFSTVSDSPCISICCRRCRLCCCTFAAAAVCLPRCPESTAALRPMQVRLHLVQILAAIAMEPIACMPALLTWYSDFCAPC